MPTFNLPAFPSIFFNNIRIDELGMRFAKCKHEDQGQSEHRSEFKGRLQVMKRLLVLILVWTLLVVTGTLVSADGQTRIKESNKAINSQFQSRQTVSQIMEAQ